jgi:homoserine O-acetyltransferase
MQISVYQHGSPFPLEGGRQISKLAITYHTAGVYKPARSKVVWVCHALTGNSNPYDWWAGLFGEGDLFNPSEYFIICANVIGSCYGTTSPLSADSPESERFHDFPLVTTRDMARAHELLRRHLGIGRIHTLIGPSLGGQQALEWAIMQPALFDHLIPIGTNARHSPWGIAFNEAQRLAIAADGTWQQRDPAAGLAGMKAARSVALLSYRNYRAYENTQQETDPDKLDGYRASSYQVYQGDKLVRRFNAFSYVALSKTMDAHHVGRGRGSLEGALSAIKARTLVIGIESDVLFPIEEQRFLAEHIPHAHLATMDSPYGHDGFLVETDILSGLIRGFYQNAD